MSWNFESIYAQRSEKFHEKYGDADRGLLVRMILELETALYPFAVTLGSLDEKSWRGTHATSNLFPTTNEAGEAYIYSVDGDHKHELSGKRIKLETIPEAELHRYEYDERESFTIADGRQLDDEFTVFSVHQQAPGAYVGCGSVHMEDIRRAVKLIFPGKSND